MRTRVLFALLALLTSSAAAAADIFGHAGMRERGPTAAALYLEVPLGARNRRQAKPVLGLRLLELPHAPLSVAGSHRWLPKTLLDVPLTRRSDDPLRDAPASNLLGKAVIVGIVVGAVVAASVLSDDDDGDGGY
ncbi:MAG TPA: hypothetical protein VKA43_04965 [Gammaproteobacteria bacterium]|nr:hypothetical protein [Gammaproteobacteria bacterium]